MGMRSGKKLITQLKDIKDIKPILRQIKESVNSQYFSSGPPQPGPTGSSQTATAAGSTYYSTNPPTIEPKPKKTRIEVTLTEGNEIAPSRGYAIHISSKAEEPLDLKRVRPVSGDRPISTNDKVEAIRNLTRDNSKVLRPSTEMRSSS